VPLQAEIQWASQEAKPPEASPASPGRYRPEPGINPNLLKAGTRKKLSQM
jgi:hypothetical protein